MKSKITIRKIQGAAAALTAGRPRALNDSMQKAVQLIYLGLMSEFFKSDMKKMGYRLNSKRAISHLAVVAEVSERVVLDVINRRGAYSKGGLSKREVEWVREFMNLSPRVYREFCDFLDGKFNVSDR